MVVRPKGKGPKEWSEKVRWRTVLEKLKKTKKRRLHLYRSKEENYDLTGHSGLADQDWLEMRRRILSKSVRAKQMRSSISRRGEGLGKKPKVKGEKSAEKEGRAYSGGTWKPTREGCGIRSQKSASPRLRTKKNYV